MYYPSSLNFEAKCMFAGHGRCSLTRTSEEGAKKGQGRPLGLLAAWMLDPECHAQSKESRKWERPSFEARMLARFLLQSERGAEELFKKERKPYLDEGEGPDLVQ